MKNNLVTSVKSTFTPDVFNTIELSTALNQIRDGTFKNVIESFRSIPEQPQSRKDYAKKKLPSFSFNGTFSEKVINNNLSESSNLFHFDIDKGIDNPIKHRELISQIPGIVFCFISTSGNGIKGAVRIPDEVVKNDYDFKRVFAYFEVFFKDHGYTLDPACKDVRRLCFVSYDPDIFINYDAETITPVFEDIAPIKKPITQDFKSDDSGFCIRTVCKIIRNGDTGIRHGARLAAGRTAGGYIAAGRVREFEILDAMKVASDSIADGGITSKSEWQTVLDGVEMGKNEPLYDERKNNTVIASVINQDEHVRKLIWETPTYKIIPKSEKWLDANSMSNTAAAPVYLVNNIIESKTHGLIAGSSQAFKSFCMLKLAHSICTGNDFFGNQVFTTGNVLYICGEGLGALKRRIRAISIVEGEFPKGKLFAFNGSLPIDNIAEMEWLSQQIKIINPVLVIYDTFSSLATSTKENENDSVARCLRIVSDSCAGTNTSSIIVHHYGKNVESGSRGASAFSANVDFEFSMVRVQDTMDSILSCKKSKDGEYFPDISIKAHIVDLGLTRQDGTKTTSLVLKKSSGLDCLTERQEAAYNGIRELICNSGIEHDKKLCASEVMIKSLFNELFESEGRAKYGVFGRVMPSLLKRGLLHESNGFYWL